MRNHKNNSNNTFTKSSVALAIGLSLSAFNTYAEEKDNKVAEEDVEVIQIEGSFQGNLLSALNDKKSSATIVDGISADDIGALPALDMGEALQAVPGVQLNREGERRESSINLRGLPSGFVLTTVNGHSIATPTRNNSGSAYGPGNPFGAYNPAVFTGITVQKSNTADMVEGGIAGTVNKNLRGALAQKETLKMQVGGRYESLVDQVSPEFAISGSKHLIEDKLAVTGTLAWSEQSFRTDSIKINNYRELTDSLYDGALKSGAPATLDDFKTANGLSTSDAIKFPGEVRQNSSVNEGDRLSFAGGIEFRPTEDVKLGLDYITTRKELDGARLEQTEVRLDKSWTSVLPDLNVAPLRDSGERGDNGEAVYIAPAVDFNNLRYYFDNRQDQQLQESDAIILEGEWSVTDSLTIDGSYMTSTATNQRHEVLLSARTDKSGASGSIYTGEGDIGAYYFNMDAGDWDDAMVLDETPFANPADATVVWSPKNKVANSGTTNKANDVYMLITGNYEQIEHESDSFALNAKLELDTDIIKSVKVGVRSAETSQDSTYAKGSALGINPTNILTEDKLIDPSYASEEEFFGGEAPGFLSAEQGWRSFDFDTMDSALRATINLDDIAPSNDGEEARLTPAGYVYRGGRQADGLSYFSSLKTFAAYAMADLEYEIGDTYFTGNVGVRYVDSSTESAAPFWVKGDDINNIPNKVFKDDYDHILPSANFSVNLDEEGDLILRAAYNKSLVRPDLRAAKPIASFQYIADTSATVKLPGVGIKPFEADSYDISLEWYNREGSAITFAYYTKEISNLFDTQAVCDSAALEGTGVDLGNLTLDSLDVCTTDGADNLVGASEQNTDADLVQAGNLVNIDQIVNIEDTITVSGYELSIQQNLNFLPYPFNGLGGVINYSKTNQDDNDENRVPGISDTSYNAIAYYEQDGYGVRLAYNYRTAYDLRTTGTANGAGDRSVKAAGRLDLSAYYKVSEDLKISFKAYNLTDNLYEEYQQNEWMPRTTKYSGQVYSLTAQYKFF